MYEPLQLELCGYSTGCQQKRVSLVVSPKIPNGGEPLARRARDQNVGCGEIDLMIGKICDVAYWPMIGIISSDRNWIDVVCLDDSESVGSKANIKAPATGE
jgi:hypothetical protein